MVRGGGLVSRRWMTARRRSRPPVRQRRGISEYPRLNVRGGRRIPRCFVDVAIRVVRAVVDVVVGQHRDGVCRRRPWLRRVGSAGRDHRAERGQADGDPPLSRLPHNTPVRPPQHRPQDGVAAPVLPVVRPPASGVGRPDARGAHRLRRGTAAPRARPTRPRRPARTARTRRRAGLAPNDGRRRAGGAVRLGLAGQRAVRARHVVARPRRSRGGGVGQGIEAASGSLVAALGRRPAGVVADPSRSRAGRGPRAFGVVRQRARAPPHASRCPPDHRSAVAGAHAPPRPAPQLCHPPPRWRSRPAGRSRSCSGTGTWRPRSATRTSAASGCGPPTTRRIHEHEHRRRRSAPVVAVAAVVAETQHRGTRPPDRVVLAVGQVHRRSGRVPGYRQASIRATSSAPACSG